MSLFEHTPHPHVAKNVNDLVRLERAVGGFNQRLAVRITRVVGTMVCAYLFFVLALSGFPGQHATMAQYIQWFSGTTLQLVMLPVLAVGTSLLGRRQELQADEQYQTTLKTYHELDQIASHQHAQDVEITRQTQLLLNVIEKLHSMEPTAPTMPIVGKEQTL
jgi:ABC-type amino acid transport system permease subunit